MEQLMRRLSRKPLCFLFAVVAQICFLVPALRAQDPAPAKNPPAPPAAAAPATSEDAATPPAPANLAPLAKAQWLFRHRNFREAIVEFQAAMQAMPADAAAARAGLARVYLAQDKISEALDSANEAVTLGPALPAAHTALGDVLFRRGDISGAEREYLVPIRAGIPDARAYYGLTRISQFTSNTKRAKHMIDKAYALDPADPQIFREWRETLDLAEQARVTRERLAAEPPASDSARSRTNKYLEALDAEAKQPNHSCHLVSKAPTVIPLERLVTEGRFYHGYALNVKVNGASSKLLLDTGASGIIVSSRIAEKAGVQRIADAAFGGFGDKGEAEGYVAYADSIKIGALEFQGCFIDVIDKKRSLGEDGLIGADVFQSFLVDLNFPDEKLQLTELPTPPGQDPAESSVETILNPQQTLHDRYVAPEMKDWERIFRSGHDLLINTYVNTTVPHLFLIDSGAYANLLSTELAPDYTKVHNAENTLVKGVSGTVKKVQVADKVKIAFAHFMQDNEDVTTVDMSRISNGAGTEISGVLGFSLLWLLDIKIDYRDGLVNFTHDPNRLRN